MTPSVIQQGGRRTNPIRGYAGELDAQTAPREARPHNHKNTREWCRGKEGVYHDFEWVSTLEISGMDRINPRLQDFSWRWERERCLACGRLGRFSKNNQPHRAERILRACGWVRMPRPMEKYWKDGTGRIFIREVAVRIQKNLKTGPAWLRAA